MTKSTTRVAADLETFTQTEITAKDVVAKAGRKNLIINGGFDVWQRGTSFTGNANIYTSDRWYAYLDNNAGFTVAKSSLTSLGNALQLTTSTAGYGIISTVVENTSRLTGTYTLSFYIKSSVSGNSARIEFRQNASGTTIWQDIAYEAIETTWTKVTKTIVLDETDNMIILIGQNSGSSATLQISQVQLELGSVATPFEHRSYGEELALCQRYYWKTSTGGSYNYITVMSCASTTAAHGAIQFPTTMRAAPTGSLSGNWQLAGAGSVSVVTSAFTNVSASHTRITLSTANGLITNAAFALRNFGDTSAYLAFDAEL